MLIRLHCLQTIIKSRPRSGASFNWRCLAEFKEIWWPIKIVLFKQTIVLTIGNLINNLVITNRINLPIFQSANFLAPSYYKLDDSIQYFNFTKYLGHNTKVVDSELTFKVKTTPEFESLNNTAYVKVYRIERTLNGKDEPYLVSSSNSFELKLFTELFRTELTTFVDSILLANN